MDIFKLKLVYIICIIVKVVPGSLCKGCDYLVDDRKLHYNTLRGANFANHQISHLAVIFAIIKFANHSMCCVTLCVARSVYAPAAYGYFDYKRQL